MKSETRQLRAKPRQHIEHAGHSLLYEGSALEKIVRGKHMNAENRILAAFEPMTAEQRDALTALLRWEGPGGLVIVGPDLLADRCFELFGPDFYRRFSDATAPDRR